jgi:hypothetical protein
MFGVSAESAAEILKAGVPIFTGFNLVGIAAESGKPRFIFIPKQELTHVNYEWGNKAGVDLPVYFSLSFTDTIGIKKSWSNAQQKTLLQLY